MIPSFTRDALAALAITTGDMGLFSGKYLEARSGKLCVTLTGGSELKPPSSLLKPAPRASFGDDFGMAELSNAIRGYGQPSAVVVAATEEDAQVASAGLVEAGYTVLASAISLMSHCRDEGCLRGRLGRHGC